METFCILSYLFKATLLVPYTYIYIQKMFAKIQLMLLYRGLTLSHYNEDEPKTCIPVTVKSDIVSQC